MKKHKAQMRRLNARIKDFQNLKSAKLDQKVRSRLDAGGFRCPGSMKSG